MKNTLSDNSRKASRGRGERISTGVSPRYQVIKLGVDTHAGHFSVARMVDQQGIQPVQKFTPAGFIAFVQKQKALAERVVMVYEAGPYGFALYRQVTELGVECLVCAPERLGRGRRRVNDKIDARELLSRLDRYLAGNRAALRLVHVPSVGQEMSRRLSRERQMYRKELSRWRGRGRSLLHTLGVSRPGRWWEAPVREKWLEQLSGHYGQEVIGRVREELSRLLEMLDHLVRRLCELTDRLESASRRRRESAASASGKPVVAKSSGRVKGIGDLSSELLDREIGDWGRFGNRRQVASYTGLCPGEDSSGDDQRSLSIDKHGNPRVRAVLVELAWLLVRFQPGYVRLRRWRDVFSGKSSKAMRKKAVVAVARQLAVDLWRMRTGRCSAADLGLVLAV